MRALLRALGLVERVATAIACALMFAIMVIVSADVAMRYVFNSPFGWAYDLISLYLMAGLFFLALSPAYAAGAHVSVDILQQRLGPRAFRATEVITTAASLAVFILIAWAGFGRALDSFRSGDVLAGAIPWPTWPAFALVPFGSGLLAFRLLLHLVNHLAGLATGRELLPLPRAGHGAERFE